MPNVDQGLGELKATRRYTRTLAAAIRDEFTPEVIVEYFKVALRGKQPVLEKDKRYAGGYRVDGKQDLSPKETEAYFKELLNRGWGLPAQPMVVDQQIHASITAAGQVVDSRALEGAVLAGLDPVKLLETFRASLAATTVPSDSAGPSQPPPAPVMALPPAPMPSFASARVVAVAPGVELVDTVVNDDAET